MSFIPSSILLEDVFLPFYETLPRVSLSLSDIEVDTDSFGNGILKLGKQYPYIDGSEFDQESRSWLWNDSVGLYYREVYNEDDVTFTLQPTVPVGAYFDGEFAFSDKDVYFDSSLSTNLGLVVSGYMEKYGYVNFYKCNPITLIINNNIINDVTVYDSDEILFNLAKEDTQSNKEFYYDMLDNKIVTNQNISGLNSNAVKLYFIKTPDSVQVKARLRTNKGGLSHSTPIVSDYILKLKGQFSKGLK